jgi:phage repressor protein C with HTH and peptisase S24 domain
MKQTITEIRLENARKLLLLAKGPKNYGLKLGMSTSQANQHCGPNPTRNIGHSLARRIELAFELQKGWLDSPASSLPYYTTGESTKGLLDYVREEGAEYGVTRQINVPIYEAPASMGQGVQQKDFDSVVGGLALSQRWVTNNLGSLSSQSNLAVLTGYGDSMQPTFADGDMLLIDTGVSSIRSDAVYVIALHNELYVKRLQRRPDQSLLMISDNKAYEPYVIPATEKKSFKVLGRVVWTWNGHKL